MLERTRSMARAGLIAVVLASVSPVRAEGPRPSWACLPADTSLLVRIPDAAAFTAAVRGSTRFGAVALAAERLEKVWPLVVQFSEWSSAGVEGAQSLAAWQESLAKYGLTMADFTAAFQADLGAGLVVRRREGLPPLVMVLAWAEPGEEASKRLLAAVKQRLGEIADAGDQPAAKRIDLEMAGHEVVSAVVPVMGIDMSQVDLEGLPGEDAEGDGPDPARQAAIRERLKAARPVQTGESHLFHALLGGRFLYASTLSGGRGGPAADPEAVGGGEEARKIFASFLAAHAGDGESPIARVLEEPALAAALPAGLPLVEAVFVPRGLVAAVAAGGAETDAQLARLGLDDVGGVAWRQTLDDGRWRSTIAATLPAPRHGLLAMLDQRCDGCDVPVFVTREVVDFAQISLDLGKAFSGVREVLLADGTSEQLTNMFAVADVQSTTWLGADVATVLSGLGSRHWFLSFPPRIGPAVAEAREAVAAGNTRVDLPMTDNLAAVWEVADEAPILKLLGRFAPAAGGQLQEEQGFRGLRLPGGAAVYVGRGHLVLAVGEGTLDKVLAAIRNPPGGDVSWRESEAIRRVRALVDMPPARMFGISDSSQTGGGLGSLREFLASLQPDDVPADARDLLAAGQKLLPTADEMRGMFGVGGTVMRMTDDGLVLESVWEMPSP